MSSSSGTDSSSQSVPPVVSSADDDVLITDVAPTRSHEAADLLRAGGMLLLGVIVILFAYYLRGTTTGVESDAHSAGQAFDWLIDIPASLLQQIIVLFVVISVLFQLLTHREWLQSAGSVGALILGFAGSWGVSSLISHTRNFDLIVSLISNSTSWGASLLPDFYAALASFLTVAGHRRTNSAVKWGWNVLFGGGVLLVITSWDSLTGVLVSLCIGRVIGCILRFALGTQSTGAWGMQVVHALRSIGIQPHELRRHLHEDDLALAVTLEDDLVENSHIYDCCDINNHKYIISVLDNESRFAGYLNQMWQLIRLNGVAVRHDRSAIDATHHHYTMMMGLHNIGLAALHPYGVADYGESSVLVLNHDPYATTRSMDSLSADDMTQLMRYVDAAHQRGYTHRNITAHAIAQFDDGTLFLCGWQNGDYSSGSTNIALDKVAMLALFALSSSIEQAVDCGRKAWGDETLINLIPFIQTAAVPSPTRSLHGWDRKFLEKLRNAISALAPEEVTESLEQVTLSRFNARSFISIVLLIVAIAVIVTQIHPAEMIRAARDANIWMALVILGFSIVAWLGSTISLAGFVDPDKREFRGLFLSQVAAGFAAVSMPAGVGPAVVNLQFLRKTGYKNTAATAIMSAVWAVQALVTALMLIVIGLFTGRNSFSRMIPTNTLILVIAGVALVISIAMAIPPVRKRITEELMPIIASYARNLVAILTQPRHLALSALGGLLLNLSNGFGFWAALLAFGYHTNPIETTFLFLLGNTLGSAIPTPGGMGAVEATLSVAFTAVGVPSTIALSATLLFRLFFYWIRIPIGAVAMRWLDRHNLL